MRDLEAICLSVDACLLRARIRSQWALELQLRQFLEDLASASPSAQESNSARLFRRTQLVNALLAAAKSAGVSGDAILGADIHRAARDLRTWYHLDDPTRSSPGRHEMEE